MARFCMRTFLLVALPVALMACAQGFEGNGDDDDDPSVDARLIDAPGSSIDAPASSIDAPASSIDAPMSTIDAPTSTIDAPTGGACTSHAQCGAGSCCFGGLMCIPGNPLPLPPPLDCIPS